jgi:protein-disulfide isomerase
MNFALPRVLLALFVITGTIAAQQPQTGSLPASSVANCGCEDKPQLEVLAVVAGTKINKQDLSVETRSKINLAQDTIVEARNSALDFQINTVLLNAEARRRGITSAKLLDLEVSAKVVQPTEADAQAFYEKNRSVIVRDFKDVKAGIIANLRQQREEIRSREFANALRATANVQVLVQSITPPANAAELNRVFATVNGTKITSADIEDSLKAMIYEVQQQVYSFRKAELELMINDILLGAEAKKRGVTARNVIDQEVTAKLTIVSEAQAEKFYNENKSRLNGDFARLKNNIILYLQQQEEKKQLLAYADRLRSGAHVQIFLTPPQSPVFKITIDDQPTKGNQNAKVTVVLFTDFECPTCALAHPILEKLITEFGTQVKFVVRDFPLPQHKHAKKAAEAAEIAREHGKYWEYIALLYKNQPSLDIEELRDYAVSLGLDREEFATALNSGKYASQVERDVLDGDDIGINSTPTFFVNGRLAGGYTYDVLKAAIEAELKKLTP